MCQSGERADVGLSESPLAPRKTGAITLSPPFFLCCPAPLRLGVADRGVATHGPQISLGPAFLSVRHSASSASIECVGARIAWRHGSISYFPASLHVESHAFWSSSDRRLCGLFLLFALLAHTRPPRAPNRVNCLGHWISNRHAPFPHIDDTPHRAQQADRQQGERACQSIDRPTDRSAISFVSFCPTHSPCLPPPPPRSPPWTL